MAYRLALYMACNSELCTAYRLALGMSYNSELCMAYRLALGMSCNSELCMAYRLALGMSYNSELYKSGPDMGCSLAPCTAKSLMSPMMTMNDNGKAEFQSDSRNCQFLQSARRQYVAH